MSPSAEHFAALAKIQKLTSAPEFKAQCLAFVDKHCDEFITSPEEEENKLEWTAYHTEYQSLVEGALKAEVGEAATAELCRALPELLQSGENMEPFAGTLEVLASTAEFIDFKAMMVMRAKQRAEGSGPPECDKAAVKLIAATGDEKRDFVDQVFSDLLVTTGATDNEAWKVLATTVTVHCESRESRSNATSGKTQYRTTMTLDLPLEHGLQIMTDLGPQRAEWDESFSNQSEILSDVKDPKTGRTDRLVRIGTEKTPALIRWAMSVPKSYVLRVVYYPLAADGSLSEGMAYCAVSWDREGNCPDKKMEITKSGTLKPLAGDEGKCLVMDQSEMKASIPPWIMGKLLSWGLQFRLDELVRKYKKAKGLQ